MEKTPFISYGMKIGIMGFGSIGTRHYGNMQKYSSDIVVLSKRDDLDVPKVVKNWSEFVKAGPYDVIFITNETYKHIPTLKRCLELKPKAIFIEKPLSHNLKDLPAVAKIIRARKISVYIGYNFHFWKPYLRIKKIIESGKLGKIYYLKAFVGQDLRVWRKRDYRENYGVSRVRGGGVVLDLVHDINYPPWLLSDELVFKTSLVTKLSTLESDTEDCAESVFTTKRNGTIVTVHQDYLRIPKKQAVEIAGEKGAVEWDATSNTIVLQIGDKITKETILCERNEMFEDELGFFFGQVKKKTFFTNIDEAIRDMKLIYSIKKYAKK